jgi:hypothetical protein
MVDSDDAKQTTASIEAAVRYFQELPDPPRLFAKPNVPWHSAGYNVARFGYLLYHLDHQPFHTVLDFGAGMCWMTAILSRTGCRVIALDGSATALRLGAEALRQAGLPEDPQRIHLLSYDGFRMPLKDTAVDRIACYTANTAASVTCIASTFRRTSSKAPWRWERSCGRSEWTRRSTSTTREDSGSRPQTWGVEFGKDAAGGPGRWRVVPPDIRSRCRVLELVRSVEEAPPGVLSVSVSNRGNGTWLA